MDMKLSKIYEIIENKVLKELTDRFLQKGFKYKKGIKGFYRRDKELLYEVIIDKDFNLFMLQEGATECYNDLYITFKVFFKTELYQFEKWYRENFGGNDHLRISTFHKVLEFSILAKEGTDFNIPEDVSANQKEYFGEEKRLLKILPDHIYQFSSWKTIKEVYDFNAHIDKVFELLDEMIATKYDYQELYECSIKDKLGRYNSEYMKYNALLIYNNQLEFPTKFITEKANYFIEQIIITEDEITKQQHIQALNKFISIGEKHLNIQIENPFDE